MKGISLFCGVVVAASMALGATAVYPILSVLFGSFDALRLVMAGGVVIYLWVLTALAPRRSGRIVCAVAFPVIQIALLMVPMQLILFCFASVAVLWLGRVLLLGRRLLDGIVDASLLGIAVVAAEWSLFATHSLGLVTWTFFLVLAARPLIRVPEAVLKVQGTPERRAAFEGAAFEEANRAAEQALTRLARG